MLQLLKKKRSERLNRRGCLWRLFDCTALPILRLFNFFLAPHVLVDRIFKLTEEIKDLQTRHYDVSQVFVTFETEAGQRTALSALKVPGRIDIAMNNTARVGSSTLFRGRVLNVEESPEPNAVRWRDISVSTTRKIVQRVISLALTVALIGVFCLCCGKNSQSSGTGALRYLCYSIQYIHPSDCKAVFDL